MDWQNVIAWLAIGLAAGYLAWRGWRSWRGSKAGCGGGCGCAKSTDAKTQPALIAPEDLVLRKRASRTP